MKTPRKLLFDRHRSVESKLDAVRQNALANLATKNKAAAAKSMADGWREFLLSCRWHLAGMTAAWLLISLLNVEHSAAPTVVTTAKDNAPSARQLVADLRENRRQLAELFEPPVAEEISPPQTFVPRRRSELSILTAVA